MTIHEEEKIDCHNHIFDPARFPYREDTVYRPAGQEIGTAQQFLRVMDAHGVRHALLVGPTSGYRTDNRCMLDAIAQSPSRFKGIAVVDNDVSRAELLDLKAAGVVGVAFNPAMEGIEAVTSARPLFDLLADLGLFAQIQVIEDQLVALTPMLDAVRTALLIDHCGRPTVAAGVNQPGFQALLRLADTGRVTVKLSGLQKFSQTDHPYEDAQVFVKALLRTFGPDACVWGSDWPFLRAASRLDYGPLLDLFAQVVPDAAQRGRILLDTPRRLFGFGA
jgi:predicted TIM-barrel fold metal-dependent hydrolase